MRLRRLLLVFTALWWALFAWMVGHESTHPVHLGRYSSEFAALLVCVLMVALQLSVAVFLAHRRSEKKRSFQLIAPLLLMFGSAVLSLGLIEVMTRSMDVFGASFFEEVTRYILDLESDERLVFKHRAGLRTTYQGVEFSTNELGLRERPLSDLSRDGTRVLFLGDSVTLGWGVAVEDVFPRQVEQRYRERLGESVVSVNAGVAGYNTVQELAFLETQGDRLKPDILVLVYVDNDIEEENLDLAELRRKWDNPPGASEFLLRWSWFYRVVHYITPVLMTTPTVDTDTVGWDNSMKALAQIASYARARGIPFVTFVYRAVPTLLTDTLLEEIEEVAAREGFPVIDLLPAFEKPDVGIVTNSFVDSHPNAKGHGIIADRVFEFLTSEMQLEGHDHED